MRNGIILSALGSVLLLATFILSSEYDPKTTLLGNIQTMYIVIMNGAPDTYETRNPEYNPKGRGVTVHEDLLMWSPTITETWYPNQKRIPASYCVLLSLALVISGVVLILLEVTSRHSKK